LFFIDIRVIIIATGTVRVRRVSSEARRRVERRERLSRSLRGRPAEWPRHAGCIVSSALPA